MKTLYLIILMALLTNCQGIDKDATNRIETIPEIEATVLKEIDGLYEVYVKSDLKWVDYYQDEYTVISTDGSTELKKAKDLRDEWQSIYSRYDVILRDHGQPTLIASNNQVVHYNTFDEIFIKKETGDTIVSLGTWIAVWKKQEDNTWKINLETYHVKE